MPEADGDRRVNDTHDLRALVAAEEAGDVLQLPRIRCNRGSRHLEEGSYHEAINELELALRLGEASGYVALHGLSLYNRAEARRRLGRLEEAVADDESARQIYQSIDSRMVGYALSGLGDVHRIRGDLTMARAADEEAVEVLEAGNDAQGLSPALAGLLGEAVTIWSALDEPIGRAPPEGRLTGCHPRIPFLVRVWHPATEPTDEEHELRGTVVHLPSRRTLTFQDRQTLLRVLEGTDHPDDDIDGPQTPG